MMPFLAVLALLASDSAFIIYSRSEIDKFTVFFLAVFFNFFVLLLIFFPVVLLKAEMFYLGGKFVFVSGLTAI